MKGFPWARIFTFVWQYWLVPEMDKKVILKGRITYLKKNT